VNGLRDLLLEIWNLLHISGTVCTVVNTSVHDNLISSNMSALGRQSQ